MNVYDFDGTIFFPNVTFKFAAWCILRHPGLLFTYIPNIISSAVKYKTGRIPFYKFIRSSLEFMTKLPDFDSAIEKFWDSNEKNVAKWYLAQKRSDDLIISGSPECILKPIADRLGVNVMGTIYDINYGVLCGNIMLAQSKSRFIIDRDMPVIENFYSDSLSDTPLALLSEKAFIVSRMATKVDPWPKLDEKNLKKIKRKIDTGWKYIED